MLRKIVIYLSFTIIFFLIPQSVQAAGEFASSYEVSYDILSSGETIVTEEITIKNLTETYYVSSFNLQAGTTQISDVAAFDKGGPLSVTSRAEGNKTLIAVKFNDQITGKDKEYKWTLRYKSRDFAQSQGKVWQVTIPKFSSGEELDKYSLTLSVPLEFGDPTSIAPIPILDNERGGKINFLFNKEQITQTGILASFGGFQQFDFKVDFDLSSLKGLDGLIDLALPPDTSTQRVLINKIDPKPVNVSIDPDGNYLAWFDLSKLPGLKVAVEGIVKINLATKESVQRELITPEEAKGLTIAQKYWDKDNPVILSKAKELIEGAKDRTNQDKARLINKFVVNTLKYNEKRIGEERFERFGGFTILNNPTNALCSEFTDLFISLARAADIPARQVIGYAYTTNDDLRPRSFENNTLHSWPEYYDEKLGWVMIDPTWENTSGGVDYFSKFDLNHVTLAIRGQSSTEPVTGSEVKVNFSMGEFKPNTDIGTELEVPAKVYAGFPSQLNLKVVNKGNSLFEGANFNLKSSRLEFIEVKENFGNSLTAKVGKIPPFGVVEYKYDLRANSYLADFEDTINLSLNNQIVERKVLVKPFFTHQILPLGVVGILGGLAVIYLVTVTFYVKSKKSISLNDLKKKEMGKK